MTDWGGFSEAELRHLRSGGDSSPPKPKTAPKTATTPKSNPKKALAARKTTKPKSQKTDQAAMLPTKQKPESEPVETQEPPEVNVSVNPHAARSTILVKEINKKTLFLGF